MWRGRTQLACNAAESAVMRNVACRRLYGLGWPVWPLTMLALAACSAPGALPVLSLRAFGLLHQGRADTTPTRALDLAFTVQLSFQPNPRRRLRIHMFVPEEAAWLDALGCSDPLLCAWASGAEQATLLALGVPP